MTTNPSRGLGQYQVRLDLGAGDSLLRKDQGGLLHERSRCARPRLPRSQRINRFKPQTHGGDQGGVIGSVENAPGSTAITFADGPVMKVQTSTVPGDVQVTGVIRSARQNGTGLDLDFEDGSIFRIQTREETSSVMPRDLGGVLEYAD